ncbi:MAG: pyridoxal-dependent decarboxylase [Oligoflexia bacterium]|nr:pyridoxal-dependent decarboxylase [Oligoflexia bacterium]
MKQKKNKLKTNNKCAPKQAALKSFFLAPCAENRVVIRKCTNRMHSDWFTWRQKTGKTDGPFFSISETKHKEFKKAVEKTSTAIMKLSARLQKEIPRHSPRYIGHMYSEYSIPSYLGHHLALMYNPNNIASETSRVGIQCEIQAINFMSNMINYPKSSRGHFTSGGTVANFEFFSRLKLKARKLAQNKPWCLYVPESAHYSWDKCHLLAGDEKSRLVKIPLDQSGKLNSKKLMEIAISDIKRGYVPLGIVSILGSTELGALDPIDKIRAIKNEITKLTGIPVWHHVDAAYGGFFASLKTLKSEWDRLNKADQKAISSISHADSITIDPHKLGYTPYSAGCFLCKKESDYLLPYISARYLDYKANKEPGPVTFEGSRTAAGPLAILLTADTLGTKGLASIIGRTLFSAQVLREHLLSCGIFVPLDAASTNIVCFTFNKKCTRLSEVNKKTKNIFNKLKLISESKNKTPPYYVSKTVLGAGQIELIKNHCLKMNVICDQEYLFLLRTTIMNPFFSTKHSKTDFAKDFVKTIVELTNQNI